MGLRTVRQRTMSHMMCIGNLEGTLERCSTQPGCSLRLSCNPVNEAAIS